MDEYYEVLLNVNFGLHFMLIVHFRQSTIDK